MNLKNEINNKSTAKRYLSPLAVWALAFGCSVGWGAFVMPGTTFLPSAGPLGTVLGLLIGMLVMAVICFNYSRLIGRYPDAGGSYTFAKKLLGNDHGFICAWMLLLTYIAIIWANSTALSIIVRYLFGSIFCFGFSYQIAGYTVYLGEVLLSAALIIITCLVCTLSKALSKWLQIICSVILFGGICACFTAVVIHCGGLNGIEPLFVRESSPVIQIMGIVLLAPWAYVGVESISHSAAEYKFSAKKTLPIMFVALITGFLSYAMLTVCASMAHPDGYSNWSEYINALINLDGIEGLPTFYNAQQAMGTNGLILLAVSALCGIITGLVGNFIALSRLICSMSSDRILPKALRRRSKSGIPQAALISVAAISCIIPFFGRTAIGWIVDVTTIGAVTVYAYVSICSYIDGKRRGNIPSRIFGIIGTVITIAFIIFYLLPSISANRKLATESFLMLIIWSILGMIIFRAVVARDKSRRFGKSEIVWMVLFILVLAVSVSWIHRTTIEETDQAASQIISISNDLIEEDGLSPDDKAVKEANEKVVADINDFGDVQLRNIFIQDGLILIGTAIVFSIFAIIKKRENDIEAERILAEEKSKAKSFFLSNMSHDIRTPMNAVTGYTALALQEENLPDNIRDYLEKIDYSSKHLLSLINDILDMSRIESGKVELNTAPADLCRVLDETFDIFVIQMKEKNLSYHLDYSGITDRYVICDKNRINRILLNLISNSFKFTPSGGRIDIVVTQTANKNGKGRYELSVEDNGIGMSEEFAKRIFDAFERERTQTVSQVQGTGLGMSITKKLVDLMEGTIEVDSEENKGTKTTIKLWLPLTDEVIHEESADEYIHDPQHNKGKRLLVVEDNPINREIACEILSRAGFETETADDGKSALEEIAASPEDKYNAVLMDIQMPIMNGYDATRAIRALEGKRSKLPIIAISANSFESDRKLSLEAGMDAHITKPFNPDELIETIIKFTEE